MDFTPYFLMNLSFEHYFNKKDSILRWLDELLPGGRQMLKYLLKRVGFIFISLFFIITITFFLMQAAPGGPFTSERKVPPKIEEQFNDAYVVDDPYFVYIIDYLFYLV